MTAKYERGRPKPTYLPHWKHLGGQTLVMEDAQEQLALPDGTQIVEIRAAGGDLYWDFGPIADTGSPGFIPENGTEIVGPMADFQPRFNIGLTVWGTTGVTAHILYFREWTGS